MRLINSVTRVEFDTKKPLFVPTKHISRCDLWPLWQSLAWPVISECCQDCHVWAWPKTFCRYRVCSRAKSTRPRWWTSLTFNTFLTQWDDASAVHSWKSRSHALFHNTAPQGGAANCLQMFQIQVPVCCLLKYTLKMSWANQRTESSISFQCVYLTCAHFCCSFSVRLMCTALVCAVCFDRMTLISSLHH